jgi:hypothetical protein
MAIRELRKLRNQVMSPVSGLTHRQGVRRAAENTVAQVHQMLSHYQKHTKGVDLCDQIIGCYMSNHRSKNGGVEYLIGCYMPNHRSKIWWRGIFFYLMMASTHNSYAVAKNMHPDVA